jgi:hypothetical protein
MILNRVSYSCRDITYFSFESPSLQDKIVHEALGDYFASLPSIIHISSVRSLSPDIIGKISHLPNLFTLEIGNAQLDLPIWSSATSANNLFPSLRIVLIWCKSASNAAAFLQPINSPVARLELMLVDTLELPSLLRVVQQQFGKSLSTLRIEAVLDPDTPMNAKDAFPDLSPMSELYSLELQSLNRIALDNSTLMQLANGMPSLQRLHVCSGAHAAKVTISS